MARQPNPNPNLRYTAIDSWETGWYESARNEGKLSISALHPLHNGKQGASSYLPVYSTGGSLIGAWGADFTLDVLVQLMTALQAYVTP